TPNHEPMLFEILVATTGPFMTATGQSNLARFTPPLAAFLLKLTRPVPHDRLVSSGSVSLHCLEAIPDRLSARMRRSKRPFRNRKEIPHLRFRIPTSSCFEVDDGQAVPGGQGVRVFLAEDPALEFQGGLVFGLGADVIAAIAEHDGQVVPDGQGVR